MNRSATTLFNQNTGLQQVDNLRNSMILLNGFLISSPFDPLAVWRDVNTDLNRLLPLADIALTQEILNIPPTDPRYEELLTTREHIVIIRQNLLVLQQSLPL